MSASHRSPQRRHELVGYSSSNNIIASQHAHSPSSVVDTFFPRTMGFGVVVQPPVIFVAPQPRIVMVEQLVMTPFGLTRQLVPVALR